MEIQRRFCRHLSQNERRDNSIYNYPSEIKTVLSFRKLETLGSRALYADTDSIIFSSKRGEAKHILNDFLGDLTIELPGNSIVRFISGGPKTMGMSKLNPTDMGIVPIVKTWHNTKLQQ